jgi:hypothetical protein
MQARVPMAPRSAPPAAVAVAVTKLTDGIWILPSGRARLPAPPATTDSEGVLLAFRGVGGGTVGRGSTACQEFTPPKGKIPGHTEALEALNPPTHPEARSHPPPSTPLTFLLRASSTSRWGSRAALAAGPASPASSASPKDS